jgi:hypothetical protein
MSATLYGVRVLSIEDDRMTCRVWVIYPDLDLPPSPTLAFEFLCDAWDRLKDGWVTKDSDAFGIKGSLTPEVARALAERAPFPAGQDVFDEEWVLATAPQVIRAVEVVGPENQQPPAERKDSAERPSATYQIRVADSAWLHHLRPGMEWKTTAYPMEEPI